MFVILCALFALFIPVAFVLIGACGHFLSQEEDGVEPEQEGGTQAPT